MSEPEPVAREPRNRAGMAGALLCLGAAALTMIGAFQNLITARIPGGGNGHIYVITTWDARVEPAPEAGPATLDMPLNGVPLLIAVAVLLAAALLGMLAVARPAARRLGRIRAWVAVAAAGFLAATVITIGVQVLWWLDLVVPSEEDLPPGTQGSTAAVGPAFWAPAVGVVLAVVGAVLTSRQDRPEPQRVEPETPRLGIPLATHAVVRRLPDEPQDQ